MGVIIADFYASHGEVWTGPNKITNRVMLLNIEEMMMLTLAYKAAERKDTELIIFLSDAKRVILA